MRQAVKDKVLTNEELLAELEDVMRSMPPPLTLHHESETQWTWLGRAIAALTSWDAIRGIAAGQAVSDIQSGRAYEGHQGLMKLMVLLRQAQSDLRLKTVGPVNVAIGQGEVFRYFDAVRQIIEQAKSDLLFVDRYMGADFVSRFLPHVSSDVSIRLLTRDMVPQLVSAAAAFAKQYGSNIEVRSSNAIHDRWVFVDKSACYQSGASFRDGGGTSGTTLTQSIDGFAALQSMYESLWTKATAHPL